MSVRRKVLMVAVAIMICVIVLPMFPTNTQSVQRSGYVDVIMPLGDSITDGRSKHPGAYRIKLAKMLKQAGYRFVFVGSRANGPKILDGNRAHEGHPGWRIDQVYRDVPEWLDYYHPSTILLHIGTNDMIQNYRVKSAPYRLSLLINKMADCLPQARIIVASLIPSRNPDINERIQHFNSMIPAIVNEARLQGKRVEYVNMNAAMTFDDLEDRVHPSKQGYRKMGLVWFAAYTRTAWSWE